MGFVGCIGIDPGLKGAIAVLGANRVAEVFDMPLRRDNRKSVIDIVSLRRIMESILKQHNPCLCVVERQWAWNKQGVTSSFSIGHQMGIIEGLLCGLGIQYELIIPYVWQNYYGIWGKSKERKETRKETKKLSHELASQLFPSIKLKTNRNRIIDGRCDALLIALWGARNANREK